MKTKISKYVFRTLIVLTILVALCYYLCGYDLSSTGEEIPTALPLLVILLLTVVCGGILLVTWFSIKEMVKNIVYHRKTAMISMGIVATCLLMLLLFYLTGDDSLMDMPQYTGAGNTPFYNRIADMYIHTLGLFVCFGVLSILFFTVKKRLNR